MVYLGRFFLAQKLITALLVQSTNIYVKISMVMDLEETRQVEVSKDRISLLIATDLWS